MDIQEHERDDRKVHCLGSSIGYGGSNIDRLLIEKGITKPRRREEKCNRRVRGNTMRGR
jgi:hypothetical protein